MITPDNYDFHNYWNKFKFMNMEPMNFYDTVNWRDFEKIKLHFYLVITVWVLLKGASVICNGEIVKLFVLQFFVATPKKSSKF